MKEERIITPTEIRFDKTQCGVDFLLNTGPGYEHAAHYTSEQDYITDYFEFLFFIKDAGTVQIDHTILELKANSILFLSPYQRHQWKLTHGTEGFHYPQIRN